MNTLTILFFTAIFLPLVVADGMDVIIINPPNNTTASANVLDPETEAPTEVRESDYDTLQMCANKKTKKGCGIHPCVCDWIDETCMFHERIEDCERFNNATLCSDSVECTWLQEPPRGSRSESTKSPKGRCLFTQDLVKGKGNCAVDGLQILSKSVCNNIKGCIWKKEGCSVALSHDECKANTKRKKCTNAGCGFQMRKKKKLCYGRWEKKFLLRLKNVEAEIAKQAIEDEYGIDTYNVVLNWPGKSISRSNASNQITLKLSGNGKVLKATIR